jgi:hypothetical protein
MGIEDQGSADERTLIEKIEDAKRSASEASASIRESAETKYGAMDAGEERRFKIRAQMIQAKARQIAAEAKDLEKAREIRELNLVPDDRIPNADNNEIPITRFIERYLPEGTDL